jgi:hypothetical protein
VAEKRLHSHLKKEVTSGLDAVPPFSSGSRVFSVCEKLLEEMTEQASGGKR